ncbi:MAG: Rieske 2Fe-2S domain-containing protein [Saprospiraceae bacterium]|nr:Rieske 2Fe-2S domain-containing protein [Saprospiraceae bacterium]
MKRINFIKTCGYTAIGFPLTGALLQSCGSIYYATISYDKNLVTVPKSELVLQKKGKTTDRNFVLIKTEASGFPICLYRLEDDHYIAALLKCTHRGCELNVGGGIYSCPCHGSEFSVDGHVIEGPATENLKIFKTNADHENIYIYLS